MGWDGMGRQGVIWVWTVHTNGCIYGFPGLRKDRIKEEREKVDEWNEGDVVV